MSNLLTFPHLDITLLKVIYTDFSRLRNTMTAYILIVVAVLSYFVF